MLESLIRSVAKLKLLKFDARSLYFECALYFAKLDPVSQKFLFAFWHTLSNCTRVLFLSIPCEMLYGKEFSLVPNDLFVRR